MANKKHLSAQEHAASFSQRNRKIALVIVALAFVMDLLDSTILNIAIPSIQTNLGASYAAIQWLVAGYSLTFALLLVTGGRMGDVYGYKKLFIAGVSGFTLASLFSGLAWSPETLIVARLLQGAMAALMVPQVMSLMQVMYKPNERGAINGLFGALGGLAASLGPVIGGVLIKANLFGLDWRPIFLLNVPIGIIGVLAGLKYLPNGKSSHPLKLDLAGTLIIIVAMTLLIFPLIQGREYDWPLWTFIMLIAAIPTFGIFAWWQGRKDRVDGSPLVLPALFKKRTFSIGLLVNLIFESSMVGFFLVFGLFLQIGLGFDPIHAALTGLPVAIGITFVMAVLGEKVLPKLGRKAFQLGTTLMAAGLVVTAFVLYHFQLNTNSWELIPGLLLIGFGMGCVFSSLFTAVLNDVEPSHAGSASGTLNAVQQVGGAMGIAIIGVIFFGQLTSGAANSFAQVAPEIRQQLAAQHMPEQVQTTIIQATQHCYVDRSEEKDSTKTPESCKQFEKQGAGNSAIGEIIKADVAKANAYNFSHSFNWAIGYEIFLLAMTFILSFFLPKHFRTDAPKEV